MQSKIIILLVLMIGISACDLEKKFHTAYLTEEEVVFEKVEMLRDGRYPMFGNVINKHGNNGILLSRYESVNDENKRMLNFFQSTDDGVTWQYVTSFEINKVIHYKSCTTEPPFIYYWLDDNILTYLGDFPRFKIDINKFNETCDYAYIEIDDYSQEGWNQRVYENGDTIITTNFWLYYISVDKGKSWESLHKKYYKYNEYEKSFASFLISNNIVTINSKVLSYSCDFGNTWQENKSIAKLIATYVGDADYRFWNVFKLSSGEYCLWIRCFRENKSPCKNVYFTTSDGINYNMVSDIYKYMDSTTDSTEVHLIDKLNNGNYIVSTEDEQFPIELITKYQKFKLPFPTHDIEYTKSGYWYYYDHENRNFCRRKIVVR